MLQLESGSNDPMAYMLTIALIQIIASGSEFSLALIAKDLTIQFFFGGVIGYALGRFSVWLINRIGLSNSSLSYSSIKHRILLHLPLPTSLKETDI